MSLVVGLRVLRTFIHDLLQIEEQEQPAGDVAETMPPPPDVAETMPPPPDAAPAVTEPFDWAPLIYIGAAALALLLVVAVIMAARGPWSRASAAREERRRERFDREMAEIEMKTLWNTAKKRLRSIEERYTSVMCDPGTVLGAPLIDDLTHQPTAAFYTAWQAVREADQPVQPTDPERVREFHRATRALGEAWDTALADARRLGASTLSSADRKNLNLAKRLLATALDEGASVPERRGALDRARTLIDRLGLMQPHAGLPRTSLLDGAVEAIATAERRALTT
ncbi:hypothetical protein [Dietzia sp. 179-F 9C3 NHS]|uniref:hypothetical protein n=1 Tax=Dietzia sp. 179-F 9C3 NHS TaxID=3374295 RepID=UPI003879A4BD